MSNPENASPNPEPERREVIPSGPSHENASSGHQETAQPHVSSQMELYAKVEYLSGLALTGLVPVSRINCSHSCLRTVLQYSGSSPSGENGISDADARRMLRDDPQYLKMILPMLTPEQVRMIVEEAPLE